LAVVILALAVGGIREGEAF